MNAKRRAETRRLSEGRAAGTRPFEAATGELPRSTGELKPQAAAKKRKGSRAFKGEGYSTSELRLPPSRRRRRWRLFRLLRFAAILAFLVWGTGALVGQARVAISRIQVPSFSPPAIDPGATLSFARGLVPVGGRKAVLLLGTDFSYARGHRASGAPVRSDTIMVLGLDPGGRALHVVSIPRDTRALVRGRYDKINAAMAQGGPALVQETVAGLLGVELDGWIQLDPQGLESLVDQLGGVKLHIDKPMHYVDSTADLRIDLEPGERTLTGAQAHQFVRFRHDGLGDIGRVQRQQQFLMAIAQQAISPATLVKAPQLWGTVQKSVRTNMKPGDLLQLAGQLPLVSRDRIQMVMLPGEFSAGRYAASYWLVDPERAQAIGRRLITGERASVSPAQAARVKITVLNGTRHPRAASQAAAALREAGWNVWGVGDADSRDVATTRIIDQTGHDEWTGPIAEALGVRGEPVAASVGDVTTDFTVVVGRDFADRLPQRQALRP